MSLKQVIDEIVKKIRKTESERQSEDLENAKEQSGKTEPDRSSTSPAVVQVEKPDRRVVPIVAQLKNNNWRKMHGIPMKRDCAKKQDQKNDDRKNVSDSDTKISNVCRRISTVIHGNMDSTREWQTGDNG